MQTEIDIVAPAGRSARVAAVGGLAARQTGPNAIHLISTAATPLGGDSIVIRVVVEAGATLHLRTVAATIALPARDRLDSTTEWHIDVAEGARLHVDPEPTIVAGGAQHGSTTTVTAHRDSTVIIAEHAQLGRAEESFAVRTRARWSGALRVDIGGLPILRHRLTLGDPAGGGHRAVSSVFRFPDERPATVSPVAYAARLELTRPHDIPGSTLTTALDSSTTRARGLCDDLELDVART
ncbi:urease accessory protein UreD [Gordonia sp. CPCC 205515]|uniref:urease accessory protein UreD n=1 Tax=Gordonia sp. CPCC 205515 TaxID=3140791 RepID=UPI003AF3BD4C